jgi:hypothetical protein
VKEEKKVVDGVESSGMATPQFLPVNHNRTRFFRERRISARDRPSGQFEWCESQAVSCVAQEQSLVWICDWWRRVPEKKGWSGKVLRHHVTVRWSLPRLGRKPPVQIPDALLRLVLYLCSRPDAWP